jgi:NAD(P)-dependent dehydrogenase (short-subunit alcohol dehydrogenase family)
MKAFILVPLVISAIVFGVSNMACGWARLYTSTLLYGAPKFTASDIPDLTGKVAVVTGGNTGIGKETARALANKGAHVIITSRSASKGDAAVEDIKSTVPAGSIVESMQLDLASLRSIEEFSRQFLAKKLPLHVLVNNAGVMKSPGSIWVGQELTYGFELTEDGFEAHIGTNHVGHFHLTSLLEEKLVSSAPSRVVTLSSSSEMLSYEGGIVYDQWRSDKNYEDGAAYGQSKLANVLFAKKLAQRLEGKGVLSYSAHPGVVKSELSRYMEAEMGMNSIIKGIFGSILFETADGALNSLYLATVEPADDHNGGFFYPVATFMESKHPKGATMEMADELWVKTEEAIKKVR